jgi:Lrp/AsnC family leucine-responsive transcriptional regulator
MGPWSIPFEVYKRKGSSATVPWFQTMELDALDVGILRALQDDARLSFRELARRTRSTTPTVSARVDRLESLGVLRGYRADIDPLRLGEASAFFVVRAAPGTSGRLAQTIASLPEVRRATETREGRIVAEAVFGRVAEARRFTNRLRRLRDVVGAERYLAKAHVKSEPRARIAPDAQVLPLCHECGQVVEGDPILRRLDGRRHYFCCPSCVALFVGRYERVKAAA